MHPLKTIFLVALLGAALAGGFATPSNAAVTKDEATRRIAEAYGVRILRVTSGEIDGRAVWLITVMNPGGDSNDAFQVNTLAVDRETGNLVPSFRQRTSGAVLPPGPIRDDRVGVRPDAVRSGTWR